MEVLWKNLSNSSKIGFFLKELIFMNQMLVLNPVLIYNGVNWFSLWEPGWELGDNLRTA